ncbi:MAG: hypothetical protein IPK67_12000 [Planctomycetes bacterium]|nr:hypothetical protein [Planctomycetota bacterium]
MTHALQPLTALLITGLAATAAASNGGEGAPEALSLTDQAPAPQAAPAPAPQGGSTEGTVINVFFKDGLRFQAADKSFTFKLGTRVAYDTNFIKANTDYENVYGLEEDGSAFRFARVSAEGSVNEFIEYKWSFEFAGGVNNRLKDVYIGFNKLCCGNGGLRVGQFKEPMGLEQLTSAAHTTFMERGASDVLVPNRNIGVMWYDACKSGRMNFAAGVFRDDGSDTGADRGSDDYIFTARVSGTPVMQDAKHLLHLGASGRRREFRGDDATLSFSGETRVSKQGDLASLDLSNVDNSDTLGLEAAWVGGPLSFQAEYVTTHFDRNDGQTGATVDGWYVFGSYFLTGDSRAYDAKKGIFSRVKVATPKGVNGGMGAVELALRASRLDLNDQGPTVVGTTGGAVDSYTAGVNWYLNDYAKIMTNYVRLYPHDDASGTPVADILQIRLQIDV